jgi:predicted ABC-type ATPase
MSDAVIIAGANGAGKTTFARAFLPMAFPGIVFLNVDEILREGPTFASPLAASREMLRRLDATAAAGDSFALETTLSSTMYVRRIADWRVRGYRVSLHFIELASADEAVARVATRVANGGHAIPEADIRRRFDRGRKLFTSVYKPLADAWYHWASDQKGTRLVAHG